MEPNTEVRYRAITYAGKRWPSEPTVILETDNREAAIYAAKAYKRSQVLRADMTGVNAGTFLLDWIVNP